MSITSSMSLMLADSYKPAKHNCKGWLISEKLDGVRAYWNHTTKKLYSRNGLEFIAPKWFYEAMPTDVDLDGELFAGRRKFEKATSAVRKKVPIDEEWKTLKYVVFDAPNVPGTFKERLEYLQKNVAGGGEVIEIIKMWECESGEQIMTDLEKYEKMGAEGLMLKNPASLYEKKRSKHLLKVKSSEDAEVEITGYEGGTGKYTGMVGSLNVKMIVNDGETKEFKVGSGLNDEQRKSPPAIGSMITIKYNDVTKNGIPRFPIFIGVRNYE
jgi:DNA ligase-1